MVTKKRKSKHRFEMSLNVYIIYIWMIILLMYSESVTGNLLLNPNSHFYKELQKSKITWNLVHYLPQTIYYTREFISVYFIIDQTWIQNVKILPNQADEWTIRDKWVDLKNQLAISMQNIDPASLLLSIIAMRKLVPVVLFPHLWFILMEKIISSRKLRCCVSLWWLTWV